MLELSTGRLYALRGAYLIIAVGLGLTIWPLFFTTHSFPEHMQGVVRSVLAAVALLSLLGLRYPVRMLPLLLFELVWKTIWLAAIGLPLWKAGRLDAETAETLKACLMAVIILPVIPWRYVVRHYFRAPGDPWGVSPRAVTAEQPA